MCRLLHSVQLSNDFSTAAMLLYVHLLMLLITAVDILPHVKFEIILGRR